MPPSASSTLVNVADDAELRLVRLLAESGSPTRPSFVQDCEACISRGDATQLLRTIVAEQVAIGALVSLEDEAASGVSLLAALLDRVKSNESAQLVSELADSITRATSADAQRTVSLLATLYNMRSEPLEKVGLLVKMIKLASSKEPSILDPHCSILGKWMDAQGLSSVLDEWKVEPAARRELYRAAADGCTSPLSKQRFTLLAAETFTVADSLSPESLEVSQQAAVGAIRDPVSLFVHQRKILSLPAIQALETSCPSLLALLRVFQDGKLEDFQAYVETNGGTSVLGQWGLSTVDCTRYIRILSLCSLAAEHEEIPYEVVASTLQTPLEEVEQWVIAAVSSGLLSAKMDQLQEKVIVESCVIRSFEMEQWKALQKRLKTWKQNVGDILDAYKESLDEQ